MKNELKMVIRGVLENDAPNELVMFDVMSDELMESSFLLEEEVEHSLFDAEHFGEDLPTLAQIISPIIIFMGTCILKSGLEITIENLQEWHKKNKKKLLDFEYKLHKSDVGYKHVSRYLEKLNKNVSK